VVKKLQMMKLQSSMITMMDETAVQYDYDDDLENSAE